MNNALEDMSQGGREEGGAHPVIAGNVLHDQYLIADKLGFGEGGYSMQFVHSGKLKMVSTIMSVAEDNKQK